MGGVGGITKGDVGDLSCVQVGMFCLLAQREQLEGDKSNFGGLHRTGVVDDSDWTY